MLWASVTSIFFQLQAWILHEECYKTRRIKNTTCSNEVVMYSMWNTVTRPLTHCTYVFYNPLADLTLVYCAIFDTQWIQYTCNDTPNVCHFWHTFNLTSVSCRVFFGTSVWQKNVSFLTHLYFPYTPKVCQYFWHTFNLTSVSCRVIFLRQVFDTKMCA